ncbi:Pre-mRNA-processing protein prp40 [Favolaschia claudopus]|uniref:Pre-mRNA-processing protein prp40 n=1 Tax=Favolaschia claudopus TaxID=2862362 RepID=A0AAW0C472_9AGAR
MATPAPALGIWTEHRNPEGRTYWFNTNSKESVWEKPDDLKTPFERALNQTKWKEYFSGGRKYYYNTETKESKWDMPDELLLVLEKVEKESPAAPPRPGFTPVGPGALVAQGTDVSALAPPNGNNDLAVGPHTGGVPFTPTSILPSRPNLPDDPVIPHNGFTTFEEGEKAFMHLLRKAGVDPTWTWEQTMRAIITDPLYKALNSLSEKKATFQKYTTNLKAKEQEDKEARLAKLRPALRNMLKGNPNVFHYTTFPTADKLFAAHPIWQQARIEAERKLIFEEYVAELKQREVQETRAARARSISKVVALFKELNVDVVTRWRDAQERVLASEAWTEDAELQKLPTLDILLAFEDYSRVREREYEDQMRRAEVEKNRKERKTREAFKALLEELAGAGEIKARTKWKDVYPLFKTDERYLNMLGNPGSNPLELFWDAVDVLDQQLEKKMAVVEAAITRYNAVRAKQTSEKEDGDVKMTDAETAPAENGKPEKDQDQPAGFVVGPETTEDEFLAVVKAGSEGDIAVESLSPEELNLVWSTMRDIALKKRADEKRRAERRQRHLQDDLRYALKKLNIPVETVEYEAAVPLMEELPEYKALEDEESRKAAWNKHVKRQKERLREAAEDDDNGSVGSRRRKEPARDHERERERDRGKEFERDPRDGGRGGRGYHRRDDYDHGGPGPVHRSSRDYGRDRDRDVDRERDKGWERERDYGGKKDARRDRGGRDRKSSGAARDWDREPRRRSRSGPPREREKRDMYEDREADDRGEKRARYDGPPPNDRDAMQVDEKPASPPKVVTENVRAESPEEGEI